MKSAFNLDRSHAAFIPLRRRPCQAAGLELRGPQGALSPQAARPGIDRCLADWNAGRWKTAAHLGDLGRDLPETRLVCGVGDSLVHPSSDVLHLGFPHAARGNGWSSKSDSARTKWLAGIVGNRVVVADDARGVERLGRLARNH